MVFLQGQIKRCFEEPLDTTIELKFCDFSDVTVTSDYTVLSFFQTRPPINPERSDDSKEP